MRDCDDDDLDTAAGVIASLAIGAGIWAVALLVLWVLP
jgi:hypothetical protein